MDPSPFLQLLMAEAPVEAFEGVVAQARSNGVAEEDLACLQNDLVRALHVRATLQGRRRREAELAALYDTAGDLTSLRDVELVLQALVHRARQLLGTDVAYLTLFDVERGDTYMRVTDGIVDARFRRLRLPMGTGLGGLVAQTRSPYVTANYLRDERFDHTSTIDTAVGGEGLLAILGVPLQLRGQVIGVLFAANRDERPFKPDEVALLESLGAHAAIAVENARLFQEANTAVADLHEANALVEAHIEAVERAAAAHVQLTDLVVAGSGTQDLAAAVAGLLQGGLLLFDHEHRVLAMAGENAERAVVDALHPALAAARATGRTLPAHAANGLRQWVAPVVGSSEHLGALALVTQRDLPDVDLRILERAAVVTALLLLGQRTMAEAEQRLRGELLDDLLSASERDPDVLRRRARLLGADVDAPHVVVAVSAANSERHRTAAAAAALAGDHGGLAGEHNGVVVLLLPAMTPADAARLVVDRLRPVLQAPVIAGGAGPANDLGATAAVYQEAARCLRVMQALGRQGAASSSDLGVYGLLLSQAGRGDLDRIVTAELGPLLDYDRRRRTNLIDTLEAYFAGAGNLSRTAQRLHIHVNTLYRRLDRVARLIGADWQEPERALQIHLALRLHLLRERL